MAEFRTWTSKSAGNTSNRSVKALNAAAHAAFLPIGIVTVLLGPMLPALSARWSLNYAQAGTLFTAQFVGATVAVALSGMIVSRWGFRFAINAGLLAVALGMGTMLLGGRTLGVLCIICFGVGLGIAVPAANLLVAEINPERRSAALNLLNFSWSVGAVSCPFLVAAADRVHKLPLFLGLVAGFSVLVALLITAMPARLLGSATTGRESDPDFPPVNWGHRSVLILGALFFLYVGTESAFGGWIASYTHAVISAASGQSMMMPSFFYGALLAGRWAAPVLLRITGDRKLARFGLYLACAGMAALVLAHTLVVVAVAAVVVGLGLASVYPITISLLAQEFGPAASRVGSLMFTLANLGGASVPWLVGRFSDQFHNLRIGLTIPLTAGLVMNALYHAKWRTPSTPPFS